MFVIEVDNVNQALSQGIQYLLEYGIREESRNGTVLVAPGPVTTVYAKPYQRVLFNPLRDANPGFHMMESLWMLNGQRDLAWPLYFNSKFGAYSDDGVTLHGAYGYRWRKWFGYDQLQWIIKELRTTPTSRRAVLSMWDADSDYGDVAMAQHGGKDVPCNLNATFDCRGGKLNMVVFCRSNDIIWGAYGANAVHLSMLQEVLAAHIGVPVGTYSQVSVNYHAYTDVFSLEKLEAMAAQGTEYFGAYYPIVADPSTWFSELEDFMKDPTAYYNYSAYNNPFFQEVAHPMYMAWKYRKEKKSNGLGFANSIRAADWRQACMEWIQRRERKQV
jgi:thymidylate synthase